MIFTYQPQPSSLGFDQATERGTNAGTSTPLTVTILNADGQIPTQPNGQPSPVLTTDTVIFASNPTGTVVRWLQWKADSTAYGRWFYWRTTPDAETDRAQMQFCAKNDGNTCPNAPAQRVLLNGDNFKLYNPFESTCVGIDPGTDFTDDEPCFGADVWFTFVLQLPSCTDSRNCDASSVCLAGKCEPIARLDDATMQAVCTSSPGNLLSDGCQGYMRATGKGSVTRAWADPAMTAYCKTANINDPTYDAACGCINSQIDIYATCFDNACVEGGGYKRSDQLNVDCTSIPGNVCVQIANWAQSNPNFTNGGQFSQSCSGAQPTPATPTWVWIVVGSVAGLLLLLALLYFAFGRRTTTAR